MSLLFDISPTDEPQKRKPKQRRQEVAAGEAAPAPSVPPRFGVVWAGFVGRLDGEVECVDENCRGTAHDVTYRGRDEWVLACCFCGTGQRVAAPAEEPEPEATGGEGFKFSDGRFAGLTVLEASSSPRWREYCVFAAAHHKNPDAMKACQTWLAENSAVR